MAYIENIKLVESRENKWLLGCTLKLEQKWINSFHSLHSLDWNQEVEHQWKVAG